MHRKERKDVVLTVDAMLKSIHAERHRLAFLAAVIVAAIHLAYRESQDITSLWAATALVAATTYALSALAFGGWRFLWVVCRTLRRDVRGILVFVKMKLIIKKHVKNGENIPSLWNKTVEKYEDKTCFFFEDEKWSFREVCNCVISDISDFSFLLKKFHVYPQSHGSFVKLLNRRN